MESTEDNTTLAHAFRGLLPLLSLVLLLCSASDIGVVQYESGIQHAQRWLPPRTAGLPDSDRQVSQTVSEILRHINCNPKTFRWETILLETPDKLNVTCENFVGNKAAHRYYGNQTECPSCDRRVQRNHRQIQCVLCEKVFHMKCTGMTLRMYKLYKTNAGLPYTCATCALPRLNDSVFDMFNVSHVNTTTCTSQAQNLDMPDIPPLSDNPAEVTDSVFSTLPTKGIRIASWNLNRLSNKFEQLKLILCQSPRPVDLIGISETFLQPRDDTSSLRIDGYHIPERRDRPNKLGGGLLAYISSAINFTRRRDLETDRAEIMWLQIEPPRAKKFLVGYVYRPPSTDIETDRVIEQNFENVISLNMDVFILGDINLNFFKQPRQSLIRNLLNMGYMQVVSEVTRFISQTCLDHIYVNNQSTVHSVIVPHIGLSDHYPVVIIKKHNGSFAKMSSHRNIRFRNVKHVNVHEFRQDLINVPWNNLDSITDPNERLLLWSKMYTDVVDKHAPFVSKRVKLLQQPPWWSDVIQSAVRTRDKLLQCLSRTRDDTVLLAYRKARNKVNYLIRTAKRKFYMQTFQDNVSNSKAMWDTVKLAMNTTTSVCPKLNKRSTTSSDCPNAKDIADDFNTHFTSVGEKYRPHSDDTIPDLSKLHDFVSGRKQESDHLDFKIPLMSDTFVFDQLRKMSNSKSTGLDGICIKLLKLNADIIAPQIAKICNLSFTTGIVPDVWKKARVVPIFKNGDTSDMGNYRPISVLPVLSKILERHVHNQYYSYLVNHKFLLDQQSGFRKNHSCQTVLTKLSNYFYENMDKGKLCGLVLIDLRKAFDLVDHDLLLHKVEIYGCEEITRTWFKYYLDNRTQCVTYDGHLSSPLPVKLGVPQGSILGPLMFILYMNDVILEIQGTEMEMYADDSTLYTSDRDVEAISVSLTTQMHPISEWINDNRMVLNINKTESMLIGSRKKISSASDRFSVGGPSHDIIRVNSHKLLGVHFDSCLSWETHVDYVCSKLRGRLHIFNKIKYLLPLKARKSFYTGLVQPLIDYGCIVWGNCRKELLLKIHVMMKRFARSILDVRDVRQSCTVQLFKELDWLPIDIRIKYFETLQMFNIVHGTAPSYLKDLFTPVNRVHSYYTRNNQANTFYIPRYVSTMGQRSFRYRGATIWNKLGGELKAITNVETFKQKLLQWLKQNTYECDSFAIECNF